MKHRMRRPCKSNLGSDHKIRQTIKEIASIGSYPSSPHWNAAIVLAAAWLVGPNLDRIASLTRCSREYVDTVAARLFESRLWMNDRVDYEHWLDPELGTIAFMMDVMVAEGQLVRTQNRSETGKYIYKSLIYEGGDHSHPE
jgi:hypothetical protein